MAGRGVDERAGEIFVLRQWGWFGREEMASDKNFSNAFLMVLWLNPQVEPLKTV